jgi:hypothetical protein
LLNNFCSRNIERACREHITFISLSGDTTQHFTTIAIHPLRKG